MISDILTTSADLTSYLQLIVTEQKIKVNETLIMMENFILFADDTLTSSHKNARAEWYRKSRQTTRAHDATTNFRSPTDIRCVFFQSICSPDLSPLDTWSWNLIKREKFTVRYRISFNDDADFDYYALLTAPFVTTPWREERLISCVVVKWDAFEYISTDPDPILNGKRTELLSNVH